MIGHAISLWQPWASLWVTPGFKVHETRHWPYPPRLEGRTILVHAAKKADWPIAGDELDAICISAFGADYRRTLPRGAYVGQVRLTGCFSTDSYAPANATDLQAGNWTEGRFAWRGEDQLAFDRPLPGKGQQGWWLAETV